MNEELRRHAVETAAKEWRESAFVSPSDLAASLYDFSLKEIAIEREACAKIADQAPESDWTEDIAKAIRARGQ